jgi:hypothetical protein
MQLSFLDSKAQEYKQYNNAFIPHLSIVDVMMFNSKGEIRELLNQYDLI